MTTKLVQGQKVRCVRAARSPLTQGAIYTIESDYGSLGDVQGVYLEEVSGPMPFNAERFESISEWHPEVLSEPVRECAAQIFAEVGMLAVSETPGLYANRKGKCCTPDEKYGMLAVHCSDCPRLLQPDSKCVTLPNGDCVGEGCMHDTKEPIQLDLFEQATIENVLAAEAHGVLPNADNVVLPKHYARFKIEPIRFICENGLNFFQGNIVKYVLRHDAKNGLEDLKKAKRYLDMFIKFQQGDENWWR